MKKADDDRTHQILVAYFFNNILLTSCSRYHQE